MSDRDPGSDQIDRRSGLAYARSQVGVEPVSPFARMLGLRLIAAEPGVAVVEVGPRPDHLNTGGTMHGGLLSALMDYATGIAVVTTLESGLRGVYAQATYSFLRAAAGDRSLVCRATCQRAPKTLGHLSAEVHDDDGRLIATGTAVMAIVRFERPAQY